MFSIREDYRRITILANFLPLCAGEDGRRCIKTEMFILLIHQRVKTPVSIWIILHPARSFHISGAMCKSKRGKHVTTSKYL